MSFDTIAPVAPGGPAQSATINGLIGNQEFLRGNQIEWFFEQTVTVDTAGAITVSVPSGFRHLYIDGYFRSAASVVTSGLTVRFNGDSGNNYYGAETRNSQGTVVGIDRDAESGVRLGIVPGQSASPSGTVGTVEATVFGHWSTARNTNVRSLNFMRSGTGVRQLVDVGMSWNNNAVVTSMSFSTDSAGGFGAGTLLTVGGRP